MTCVALVLALLSTLAAAAGSPAGGRGEVRTAEVRTAEVRNQVPDEVEPESTAGCPSAPQLLDRLRELPLERSTRATLWGSPLPPGLRAEAAEAAGTPDRVVAARDGKKGHGLAVVELPREALWKAIQDEDRYAEDLGLVASRVVAGTPRGAERWIFQAFRRLGVGRWWVDRVRMNGPLARETDGALWELTWTDDFDAVVVEDLPADLAALAADLRPVEWTRGAWVFAPLSPACTLVDYFVWSEPGGLISGFQALGAKRAVADTVAGLVAYARRGAADRPGGREEPFLDPTGAPLETSRPAPAQSSPPP